jgi:hypothetical protein
VIEMTFERKLPSKLIKNAISDIDDINFMLKSESIEVLSQDDLEQFEYHIMQAWNILIRKFKI